MAKYHEEYGDRQPGEQESRGVAGATMITPEIDLRVDDEPVERNRQLREKNDSREPAEGRHAGILVESRGERQYFRVAGIENELAMETPRTPGTKRSELHALARMAVAHIVGATIRWASERH